MFKFKASKMNFICLISQADVARKTHFYVRQFVYWQVTILLLARQGTIG